MVKVIATISRLPGQDRADFLRHWQHEHPEFVSRMPGIRRYRQQPVLAHHRGFDFDGVAELWFDSIDAVRQAFASPAADELRRHEELFVGELRWSLVDEDTRVDVDLARQ